jgi:hypothetical protein
MTNNKQQTAVEWFWNQLPEILPFTVDTKTAVKLQKAYEQAKEIGKEQIIDTYNEALYDHRQDSGTKYYNETFGGGEQ